MWSPGQLTRSPSVHSMAGSIASTPSSNYGEAIAEHVTAGDGEVLLPKKAMVLQSEILQGRPRSERSMSASTQNTNSTLAIELHEEEINLKTPTIPEYFMNSTTISTASDDASEPPAPRAPEGSLQQKVDSLIRNLAVAKQNRPTNTKAEWEIVQQRVTELEAENKTLAAKYMALMEIRCGDLENLIKIRDMLAKERREHDATKALREDDLANVYKLRGMLAKERREHDATKALREDDLANVYKVRGMLAKERRDHDAMKALRDDDLDNVHTLRDKLAQMTWSQKRSISTERMSIRHSRTEGDDLWQVAKTAALEHRIVELEQANKALQARASTSGPCETMTQVKWMFEESLKYGEKMASKIQQLQSEKEALQKEVSVQNDRNTERLALAQELQMIVAPLREKYGKC